MKLDELLGQLPALLAVAPLAGPFRTVPRDAIQCPTQVAPWFMTPPVAVQAGIDLKQVPVVLVSAPAGVGKTTAAALIAKTLRTPLWNLAKLSVGHGPILGILGDIYGAPDGASRDSDLASGAFSIVMDALDEVRLRGGAPSQFDLLLNDVAAHCRSGSKRERPSFVILGRVDTCEAAARKLLELGVQFATADLQYFDQNDAREFIARRLDSAKVTVHRGAQKRDFDDALGTVFDVFGKSIGVAAANMWLNDEVRRFLGYAPVLVAIAAYMREWRRYGDLKKQWEDRAATGDQWRTLAAIMHDLLRREQTEKFENIVRPQVTSHLKPGETIDWNKIFTPLEQCTRALERVVDMPLIDPHGIPIPDSVRSEYDEAVAQKMEDHPLTEKDHQGIVFRSIVFQEYVYATELVRGADYAIAVLIHMESSAYRPTPLLAGFLLGTMQDQTPSKLGLEAFGHVYESFSLHERPSTEIYTEVGAIADGALRATVTFWKVDPKAQENSGRQLERRIEFRLNDTKQPVRFPYRLRRAAITLDSPVTVGCRDSSFILGPSVHLDCARFACEATSVYVHAGQSEEEVALSFDSYDFSASSPRVAMTVEASGDAVASSVFEVNSAGNVPDPWRRFYRKADLRNVGATDAKILKAFTDLRGVLGRFYKNTAGDWLIFKQFMDNVYASSARKATMLRYLQDMGIIRDEGSIYRLMISKLEQLGLVHLEIKNLVMSQSLKSFLEQYVKKAG